MSEEKYVSYRWVMLGLSWLVSVSLSWAQILVSPYASRMMADLSMTDPMRMAVFGAPLIIRVFLSLPGGILADKFGMKRMIIGAGVVAGIAGVLRGFSTDFGQFFGLSVLLGFGMAVMQPNLAKLVRDWFPAKEIGTASGIQATAFAGGFAFGSFFSYPLFGTDWRLACSVLGGFTLLATAIWFFLAKEKGMIARTHPIKQDLLLVIRHRDLWMATVMTFVGVSGVYTFAATFPVALETERNIEPAIAAAVTSMAHFGGLSGNLISPFFSDRFGRRRPFVIGAAILGSAMLFLAWNTPFGGGTWLFSYLTGFCVGTIAVLSSVIVIEHKGIPMSALGTARGFQGSVSNTGLYLLPLLGGYISDWSGYGATFLAAALMVLTSLVFSMLGAETGPGRGVKMPRAARLH